MPIRRALGLLLAALASPAAAHIQLVYPPARSGTSTSPDLVNQKVGPCGLAGRSARVTTLLPGSTITVLFDEAINHPGEFRVAFDVDGDDDLAPPAWDGTTWNTPPAVVLLAEHVPDLAPGVRRGEVRVTLPSVACTRCTLQLMQAMTDKPPLIGDDDFYFMCADLVLEAPLSCGNGAVEGAEACDDGNASNEDACLDTCVAATCGDGFLRAGVEACDDGDVSNEDACLDSCVAATCGDGFVRAGVEACDDGDAFDGDGCSASCQVEPSPASPPASGGGCGSAGSGVLGLALAALPLVSRRRRRPQPRRGEGPRCER